MLKFKVNPLWCCYEGPGPGGINGPPGIGGFGGLPGDPGSGHGVPADPGAFGDNDANIDATISAMVQSMAQAEENSGQNAIAAMDSDIESVRNNTLFSFLKALIFPMGLTGMATTIGMANYNLSKAKSALADEIGQDRAEEAFAHAFEGFNAEHATDISPEGDFTEADLKEISEKLYGFDAENATQEQKDRYMVEQYYESKNPSGTDMGRDDFEEWVDQELQNIQDPKYRLNRSQEIGLPAWYKSYLNSSTQDFLAEFQGEGASSMADTNNDWVLDAYGSINRTGKGVRADQIDAAGLAFWNKWLEDNPEATKEEFQETFNAAVQEYQEKNPDSPYTTYTQQFEAPTGQEDWVRDMYENIGREGIGDRVDQIDQPGYNFWTNWLAENPDATKEEFEEAFTQAVADYQTKNPDSPYSAYTDNFMPNPNRTYDNVFDLDQESTRTYTPGHMDLLESLTSQAQDLSGRSISATVGGQPITVMPRSNQDQLNMLMGHLMTGRKLSELEHQFDEQLGFDKSVFNNTFRETQSQFDDTLLEQQRTWEEQVRQFNQNFTENQRQFDIAMEQGAHQFDITTTPSTVDKASQILGLGSDALNLYKTLTSDTASEISSATVDALKTFLNF